MSAPNIHSTNAAFPHDPEIAYSGLSIREYFAAHAPAEIPEWFEPKMPPVPKKDPKWKWCEGCNADSDCDHNADCEQLRLTQDALTAWRDEEERQKVFQWPAAWADMVLKHLATGI